MDPNPLAIAEVTATGTPPGVVVKLTYDEYAQRVNAISENVAHMLRASGSNLSQDSTPLFVKAFLRVRFAPVVAVATAEGLAEHTDADVFLIDRSLLAAPLTLTLSTTGYPLPADRMVHVSIIGAGPDVTLSVPGVGTTNHGGTAAVMRVFERGASGWIEH